MIAGQQKRPLHGQDSGLIDGNLPAKNDHSETDEDFKALVKQMDFFVNIMNGSCSLTLLVNYPVFRQFSKAAISR